MANILIRSEIAGAPATVWTTITDRAVLRAAGARVDDGEGELVKGERVGFAGMDWKVALMDEPNVMVWVHREVFGWASLKVRFALTPKANGTELTVIAGTSGLLGWTMRDQLADLREALDALARTLSTRPIPA